MNFLLKVFTINLLLVSICLKSNNQNDILKQMYGLSLKGDMVFAIEGYMMTIQKENGSLDKKGIQKIKSKYKLKDVLTEYADKSIKWENWVIEKKTKVKGLPEVEGFQKYYLLPQTDKKLMLVLLQSTNGRDTIIEKSTICTKIIQIQH